MCIDTMNNKRMDDFIVIFLKMRDKTNDKLDQLRSEVLDELDKTLKRLETSIQSEIPSKLEATEERPDGKLEESRKEF